MGASPEDEPPRVEAQSETVGPPHRDEAPPRRTALGYVWLAIIVLAALTILALITAVAIGFLSDDF